MSIKSNFLWLYFPFLIIFVQILIEIFIPHEQKANFHSEFGPHEMVQSVILLAAGITAFATLMLAQVRARLWIAAWTGIAFVFVCCIYVFGEELSWGQHIFQWSTPEYWTQVNDQGETNFHNTSSWLDQKPRLLLEIGVLVGGIIIPALRYFNVALPKKFELIYPNSKVFVTAMLALVITITDKIDDALKDINIIERASEVEELYLYLFVLIYLVYFRKKMASL